MASINSVGVKAAGIMPVRDQSSLFTYVLALTWLAGVAAPILFSLTSGNPAAGLPLLGVVVWFLLVRGARWLSPASQADTLMRRGRYEEALRFCDRALAIDGEGAWVGTRRLVWLNRRTTALISLGRGDEALQASFDALAVSADPETLGNCALALLRLNRYDEAVEAGRLALHLTRERSVLCQGVFAIVTLAKQRPAEAEATAGAGLEDSRALYPFARMERYAMCLAASARAIREQIRHPTAETQGESFGKTLIKRWRKNPSSSDTLRYQKQREMRCLNELRRLGRRSPLLRAVAHLEEADFLSDQPENSERVHSLLESAYRLAPEYCFWFVQQPGTFDRLIQDPRLMALREEASALFAAWNTRALDPEIVKQELIYAEETGRAQPGAQSSYLALMVQLITLSSTFTLLLLWIWRFLILTS